MLLLARCRKLVAPRCLSTLADIPQVGSVMLRPSSPAASKLARTSSNNAWADDAFFAYVERRLRESQAAITQDNIQTVFTEMLVHGIPAGNA